MAAFPDRQDGMIYLTEGGQETEVMYKHGFELPEFSMYPLLDDPAAVDTMRRMYEACLEVAARNGTGIVLGGLDYRASPDWAARLGYSVQELADFQMRAIEFLRSTAEPFQGRIPSLLIAGTVGPRGDAYLGGETMDAVEAERYHGEQVATLARADVDLVEAMTFNNVPEAIGVARAAARWDVPASISFTLDSSSRLSSGPSLRDAIEMVDDATGDQRPAFYGINCSHPYEFIPAIGPGDWFERVRCLRPNAAMMDKVELCTLGHLEEGDPPGLGVIMGDLASRHPHIDIWGGCCGTWDVHLEAIARNVIQRRSTSSTSPSSPAREP